MHDKSLREWGDCSGFWSRSSRVRCSCLTAACTSSYSPSSVCLKWKPVLQEGPGTLWSKLCRAVASGASTLKMTCTETRAPAATVTQTAQNVCRQNRCCLTNPQAQNCCRIQDWTRRTHWTTQVKPHELRQITWACYTSLHLWPNSFHLCSSS